MDDIFDSASAGDSTKLPRPASMTSAMMHSVKHVASIRAAERDAAAETEAEKVRSRLLRRSEAKAALSPSLPQASSPPRAPPSKGRPFSLKEPASEATHKIRVLTRFDSDYTVMSGGLCAPPLRRHLLRHGHAPSKNGVATEGVLMASYSEDGSFIATAGGDGNAIVWRFVGAVWSRAHVIRHSPTGAKEKPLSCTSAVFAPLHQGWFKRANGVMHILTAGDSGIAKIFAIDVAVGAMNAHLQSHDEAAVGGMSSPVSRMHIGATGHSASSAVPPGKHINTYQEKGVHELVSFNHPATAKGRLIKIRLAKFCRNGNFLATACFDKTARIWSITGNRASAPDGAHHAHGKDDKPTITCVRVLEHSHLVWSIDFADGFASGEQAKPGCETVATACHDKTTTLWTSLHLNVEDSENVDDEGFEPVHINTSFENVFVLHGHSEPVTKAVFHPSYCSAAAKEQDVLLQLIPVATKLQEKVVNLLATASYDQTVMLWSTVTRRPIHTFRGHKARVWSVAFSSSTTHPHLISADDAGGVRIWDVTAKVCVAILVGHTEGVWSACFSPPKHPSCKDMGALASMTLADKKARIKVCVP
tara:strand:- start:20 stop:1786 length:1767 start_codon:yes stop_codon:yes gene_type:complete